MGWIDEKRLKNGLLRPLTPRQHQVAKLTAQGLGPSEIADRLDPATSVTRVKQHLQSIATLLPNPNRLSSWRLVMLWAARQPEYRPDDQSQSTR